MTDRVDRIRLLIDQCTPAERRSVLEYVRRDVKIHPLEDQLGISAEEVLEAISRASDLSLRGVRGLIAEASFAYRVLSSLGSIKVVTFVENRAYDFLLQDAAGQVSLQVKMQRQVNFAPMLAKKAWRPDGSTVYIVETQKSRTGTSAEGSKTRPYRYGEFDILAVSMHPSTLDWGSFMYTVSRWLLPRPEDSNLINTLQPVSPVPNDVWTNDLPTAIEWHRSGAVRRLA